MKFYLPANLELEKLLLNNPPHFKYHIDNFKYLLSHIPAIPATNKKLDIVDGFIPISSKILKSYIPNYNLYFKYLSDNGVIEICHKYFIGEKCKRYRFTDKYRLDISIVEIENPRINRYIKKETDYDASLLRKHRHLKKWLNPLLKIDSTSALEYTEFVYQIRKDNKELWELNQKGRPKDPLIQKNCNKINIDKMESQIYRPFVDQTTYRFHSTITSLKSELRNFVTYDNQQIISLDVKNSQPFDSTVILKPEFWTKSSHCVNIYDITSVEVKNYFINTLLPSYPLMWEKFNTTQYQEAFQIYGNIVEEGFYEYLENAIKAETGKTYNSRKKVKEMVFQVLFSRNILFHQEKYAPKRIFAKHFPEVYEFFSFIKSLDYKMLSRLLQSIESYVFLQVITKRISKERSDLLLLTIHDNIATTVGNENYVSEVMIEELQRLIGRSPTIVPDHWRPENLIDSQTGGYKL